MITKPIRLSFHATEQIRYRGTSQEEVIDAIRASKWTAAELDRMECRKDFRYNKSWNNKNYQGKQVRPVFVEGTNEIVVVTVYVYYF